MKLPLHIDKPKWHIPHPDFHWADKNHLPTIHIPMRQVSKVFTNMHLPFGHHHHHQHDKDKDHEHDHENRIIEISSPIAPAQASEQYRENEERKNRLRATALPRPRLNVEKHHEVMEHPVETHEKAETRSISTKSRSVFSHRSGDSVDSSSSMGSDKENANGESHFDTRYKTAIVEKPRQQVHQAKYAGSTPFLPPIKSSASGCVKTSNTMALIPYDRNQVVARCSQVRPATSGRMEGVVHGNDVAAIKHTDLERWGAPHAEVSRTNVRHSASLHSRPHGKLSTLSKKEEKVMQEQKSGWFDEDKFHKRLLKQAKRRIIPHTDAEEHAHEK